MTATLRSLVLRGVGMVATFLLGVQLARYLGPVDLGIYGLVVSFTLLLSAFGQLGLPTLATREVALAWMRRDYPKLRGLLHWLALVSLVASVLLALVVAVGAKLWSGVRPAVGIAAFIGAPLIPVFALTVLVSAELRAVGRLVLGQSLEILVRPLVSCFLLAAAFVVLGYLDAALAIAVTVSASVFSLLLGCFWLVRELPAEVQTAPAERHVADWIHSARPLAITDILRQADGSYAILLIGLVASNYETGIFRVAQSTILALAIPLFVVQVVVAPTLAQLHESLDHRRLQRLLAVSAGATFGGGLVGLVFMLLAGPGLLELIFGPAYAASWLPLVILCVAQLVNGFFGVGFVLLPMAGAERDLTIGYAASVAIAVISAIPLIAIFGASGAALAVVIGALANGLLIRCFARRSLNVETSLIGLFVSSKV